MDALRLIDGGDLTASQMVGAWAGELGQTQFLPTEYNTVAVDFDGDGKRNLLTSSATTRLPLAPICSKVLVGAVEHGCKEVLLVNRDGYVTEGSHSNAYMVTGNGVVLTHPADNFILNGVRRQNVLWIAKELGIKLEERKFTLDEAKQAKEVFMTSANTNILPVVKIDDTVINTGKAGEITAKIKARYRQHVTEQTGKTWE